jgi:hypothetical protein
MAPRGAGTTASTAPRADQVENIQLSLMHDEEARVTAQLGPS